jgi:hypothetical protein
LLSLLPKTELDRIDTNLINEFYDNDRARAHFMALKGGKLDAVLRK